MKLIVNNEQKTQKTPFLTRKRGFANSFSFQAGLITLPFEKLFHEFPYNKKQGDKRRCENEK